MKKGFTVVESIVTVAIFFIFSIIFVSKYIEYKKDLADTKVYMTLGRFRKEVILNLAKDGTYPQEIKKVNTLGKEFEEEHLTQGINGKGDISSYQMKAGTVKKGKLISRGREEFKGKKNIVEIYYNRVDGSVKVDSTYGNNPGYLDTKGNEWRNY